MQVSIMTIVLTRIDDRLIHGQVVEGWLKSIRANRIVVLSDDVARDKMQQILMGMAVPASIKVCSFSIDDGAGQLLAKAFDGEKDRVLLLLSRPRDVVRLLAQGVRLATVNVGGMHFSPGKRQVLRNLSVDDDDVAALRQIAAAGVELEGRVLPQDDRVNIMERSGFCWAFIIISQLAIFRTCWSRHTVNPIARLPRRWHGIRPLRGLCMPAAFSGIFSWNAIQSILP
jgi:mannose/fructose/sorbose-specific phosphotransferase system IIB component